MQSYKQAQAVVGKQALLTIQDLTILVEIIDARECWGRKDYRVKPTQGSGRQWVSTERVRVLNGGPSES